MRERGGWRGSEKGENKGNGEDNGGEDVDDDARGEEDVEAADGDMNGGAEADGMVSQR